MIVGKRGTVANVEMIGNVFEERRPILIENAPHVRSAAICDNRHIGPVAQPQEGLNAFAKAVEVVSLQDDCRAGRDRRFEMNRGNTKKNKKEARRLRLARKRVRRKDGLSEIQNGPLPAGLRREAT